MKIAKATDADLDMAMTLCGALDALTARCPLVPEGAQRGDDAELFDPADPEQAVRVLEHLRVLADSANLGRVVYGCAVMLDPKNQCVDPAASTLEHHPDAKAGLDAKVARPLCEWDEADGPVLWWAFLLAEAPWCGTPNWDSWPGYHTHWTPIIRPNDFAKPRV